MRDKRRAEAKIDELRGALKRSNGERERLIQSELEFRKAQYDYQKHLMTIELAAAAAFIALLGGLFGGDDPWAICIVFDGIKEALKESYPWMKGVEPSFVGNIVATVAIVLIMIGFFVSLISSAIAAQLAHSMIKRVHLVREGIPLDDIVPFRAKAFRVIYAVAVWMLLVALIAFAGFFVIDNVLNYFRDPSCIYRR